MGNKRKRYPGIDPDDTPLRRAGQLALRIVPAALAGAFLAVLFFNLVVMPSFVSHGDEVEVPDVVGFEYDVARAHLAEYGLSVRDTTLRPNPDVSEGVVLDQEPKHPKPIKPERGVRLVISTGMGRQRIPNLAKQTLRTARLNLNREGYVLGDVLRVHSDEIDRDFVVATDPPGGDVASRGSSVHLLVSAGPERGTWVMPDLRGRELRGTADRLQFAGFPVQVIEDPRRGFGMERVVSTEPAPGARVALGDTLRLFAR